MPPGGPTRPRKSLSTSLKGVFRRRAALPAPPAVTSGARRRRPALPARRRPPSCGDAWRGVFPKGGGTGEDPERTLLGTQTQISGTRRLRPFSRRARLKARAMIAERVGQPRSTWGASGGSAPGVLRRRSTIERRP